MEQSFYITGAAVVPFETLAERDLPLAIELVEELLDYEARRRATGGSAVYLFVLSCPDGDVYLNRWSTVTKFNQMVVPGLDLEGFPWLEGMAFIVNEGLVF